MFILKLAMPSSQFVKVVMLITSPVSVPLGWCLRRCKLFWTTKEQAARVSGTLSTEQLVQFVALHEVAEGLGGEVNVRVSELVKGLLSRQDLEVGNVGREMWGKVVKVQAEKVIDEKFQVLVREAAMPFVIVMRCPESPVAEGQWLNGVVSGQFLGILPQAVCCSCDA